MKKEEFCMSTTTAKKDNKSNVTVVKKMRNYSNDPVFKKKAEDAMKFLKKHGLPKSVKKTLK
jgi:hypothetical protein